MGAIYLGIDMGTTSAKALAVDECGVIRAQAQQGYPMRHPHPGWAEQEPEDYWRALIAIVRDCVEQCCAQGYETADIAALAMSTQGDTLILADAQGRALAPAMSWMDMRPEAEFRRLLAAQNQDFWYRETGMRLVVGSSACAVAWIAAHRPDVWAAVRRVGAVPDYLTVRLCGEFVTDTPSASWSPYFTPQTRSWSAPVLELLGVSVAQLPRVVSSGTTIGRLLPEAAAELGLSPSTVLVAGAFDQAAAALGAGAAAGGRSVLSCGTAWVLYAVASALPSEATADASAGAGDEDGAGDAGAMLPLCCHTSPADWGVLVPFTGGAAYDWCRRNFRFDTGGSDGIPKGEAGSDEATDDRQGFERDALYFLPYFYGAGAPDWQAEARGTLLGLTMAHTGVDVERAVQRGIACETRQSVELAEAQGAVIPCLRMVGGATKSQVWPQMVADAIGRPIEVSACSEAAAYGAAMLAAGPRSEAWQEMAPLAVVTPSHEGALAMEAYYARYLHYRRGVLKLYS